MANFSEIKIIEELVFVTTIKNNGGVSYSYEDNLFLRNAKRND